MTLLIHIPKKLQASGLLDALTDAAAVHMRELEGLNKQLRRLKTLQVACQGV
jgi:hypothetical protein